MPVLRAVLSDLDDTLFDHHRATRDALSSVRDQHSVFARWSIEEFQRRHGGHLEALHIDFLQGRLSADEARRERFRRLLVEARDEAEPERAMDIARSYRQAYERCWHPVAGARDLLELVKAQGLSVVVVTNNSVLEQREKLERTGLWSLVDRLVTSEEVRSVKPEPEMFHAALDAANATIGEAVMLGDAWAIDIEGARRIGLRAVWLNRFEVSSPDATVAELRSLVPAADVLRILMAQ
jgi:putative hydrolase of the HAD superfamily